eukprot:scaffold229557_cov51-Prasinocladus_malaysianus.AAC.2
MFPCDALTNETPHNLLDRLARRIHQVTAVVCIGQTSRAHRENFARRPSVHVPRGAADQDDGTEEGNNPVFSPSKRLLVSISGEEPPLEPSASPMLSPKRESLPFVSLPVCQPVRAH